MVSKPPTVMFGTALDRFKTSVNGLGQSSVINFSDTLEFLLPICMRLLYACMRAYQRREKICSKPSEKRKGVNKTSTSKRRFPSSPQKVGLSFPLEDGDTVEIHTK